MRSLSLRNNGETDVWPCRLLFADLSWRTCSEFPVDSTGRLACRPEERPTRSGTRPPSRRLLGSLTEALDLLDEHSFTLVPSPLEEARLTFGCVESRGMGMDYKEGRKGDVGKIVREASEKRNGTGERCSDSDEISTRGAQASTSS